MKSSKLKLMLIGFIFVLGIIISTSVLAANEDVQILKKSDSEYMIYISEHLDSSFEFAFSNDKNSNKEELNYKNAATDTAEENANYIAYVDESLHSEYFGKTAYLWARTLNGEYFAQGIEINLADSTTESEVEIANNITKTIKVDTTNTVTTTEMVDDVKVTKTVGKVDVLEEGTTYYQLVKLPSKTEDYNQFMKVAEQIANSKVEDNMYAELEVASTFAELYERLVPEVTDSNWVKVENNIVLQPEEAEDGEQYILWLKNETSEDTKLDAQFLTCFADYKPEVISEKVVTKLPVTADDPTLFIILAILVVALIVVCMLRMTTKKEVSAKRKNSKH